MRPLETEWYRIDVVRKCSVASRSRATASADVSAPRARGPGFATRTVGSRSRNCLMRGDSILASRVNARLRSR